MKKETEKTDTPGILFPWYVHLLVGYAFSGLFSWILVARQALYLRGRMSAALLVGMNVLVLAGFVLASVTAKMRWDTLLTLVLGLNMVWAAGAWLFQRHSFGPAPRRYRWNEWKSWLSPITTAIVLAAGLAVVMAVFPVLAERLRVMSSPDILDKKIVLWDFFTYVPLFASYGLLVGLWWAGDGQRFSVSTVIAYLAGFFLFFVLIFLSAQLFVFLLFKGEPYQGIEEWPLFAYGVSGWRGVLVNLEKYDQLAYVLAPLLLGSVSRVREFCARAVVVFPAVCLCLLSLAFYYNDFWSLAQGHIRHEMTSPDETVRAKASRKAEVLLARYPNHDRWPEIALLLATEKYKNKEFEEARKFYGEVAERYKKSPRWSLKADFADAIVHASGFGMETKGHDIELPLINHEPYLTPNWMTLLQIIRYWDKGKRPESEILIELRSLSKSDEKIKLSPLPRLSDLHDAAASLGFEMLIIPARYETARSFIRADIPVILPVYSYFNLLNGIDDSRALVTGCNYHKISERLRGGDREEVREILFPEQEGKGESVGRMRHIASQAYVEFPERFWGSPLQGDSAPFMAVVYPAPEVSRVAAALSAADMRDLERESRGYLAALIALNALDAADPVQSVQWAMTSMQLVDYPLAYQVGYLAERFWRTRDSLVTTRLDLTSPFPELSEIDSFFESPPVRDFLKKAARQFAEDLSAGNVPWILRSEYGEFLDRSKPQELDILIELARRNVSMNPNYRRAWLDLAELYEWKNDVPLIVSALEGALQADSWSDELALLLAYRYAQTENREKLQEIMNRINPEEAVQNPYYFYCKGMLAAWSGRSGRALEYLAKAIEMRRSDPLFHLGYGEVLLREGRKEEAGKALHWAMQIDVENGDVRTRAGSLLRRMEK
ncbi:MAG: hypothetical protein Kow0089_08560 [Desulfobulbaceae bacterium]